MIIIGRYGNFQPSITNSFVIERNAHNLELTRRGYGCRHHGETISFHNHKSGNTFVLSYTIVQATCRLLQMFCQTRSFSTRAKVTSVKRNHSLAFEMCLLIDWYRRRPGGTKFLYSACIILQSREVDIYLSGCIVIGYRRHIHDREGLIKRKVSSVIKPMETISVHEDRQ